MSLTNETLIERNTSKRIRRYWLVGFGAALLTGSLVWAAFFPIFSVIVHPSICNDKGFFVPNMTFGIMTFMQAKSVDITWNLAAGHGVQALVGLITYRTMKDALLRIIQLAPVSYETFLTMSLDLPMVSSLVPLFRAILRTGGWRGKAILISLFICVLFTLALPTLLNSATGYIQINEAWINWPNGTMALIGESSWRVGLQGPDGTITFYVNTRVYTLPNGTKILEKDGLTYPISCVPTGMYQWGFSLGWVVVSCSLFLVWVWCCYGIWVDSNKSSRLPRLSGQMGQWRAVVDLGQAMHEELGPDLSGFSEPGLRQRLRQAPLLKYSVSTDQGWGTRHIQLTSRQPEPVQRQEMFK